MAKSAACWCRLIAVALVWTFTVIGPAGAQLARVESSDAAHAGEFVVPISKSQILELDVPFTELLVGNPEIADVLALSDRSIYALGRALGSTSLTIRGAGGELVAVVDLVVAPDIEGLKQRLFELMPDEDIEVRPANGSLVLSGSVQSASRLSRVIAVAEQFAPERITNLLSVRDNQQVMLQVRFAEISRTFLRNFELNSQLLSGDFSYIPNFTTDLETIGQATLGASFGSGATLDLFLDALEEKGIIRTLAEPNLLAMSGDTASFLAGGEFPVPIPEDGRVVIEFKPFGVSLAFTPTVLEDGLINVIVAPEVSKLDNTIAVEFSGFKIPGLRTRRARTTVELRDGQSFAIAGLIQEDFEDTVRQLPGLGDVPILGALMRSTAFQRQETELVIIIEPHLVQAVPAGTLRTPTENFIPPSGLDMILFGRAEAPGSGAALTSPGTAQLLGQGTAGGIEGAYGHIIK